MVIMARAKHLLLLGSHPQECHRLLNAASLPTNGNATHGTKASQHGSHATWNDATWHDATNGRATDGTDARHDATNDARDDDATSHASCDDAANRTVTAVPGTVQMLSKCPWKEYKSDNGKAYYYNSQTKESRHDKS
ncbi:unnamed protein product [Coregonus sp. 'balchen']|nr:unnamed protein product [Coregonus sp. 'balchen']